MPDPDAFLSFQRAKFKTRLPRARLYTPGHMWLREVQGEGWQIGLTRFAQRMLGEPVEIDFELAAESPVDVGQPVGWLEGFKAVTDLYSPLEGRFLGGNPALDTELGSVRSSSYDRGWLFAVDGEPGPDCVDAEGYASFLEVTIDKMLGDETKQEQADGGAPDERRE